MIIEIESNKAIDQPSQGTGAALSCIDSKGLAE